MIDIQISVFIIRMRINSISVYGLFDTFEYNIELCDGPITYLHALNGAGKTTLARAVCAILKGDLKEVSEVPFERIDICFDDESTLIVENNNGDLLVQMQKNEIESEITPEELSSIMGVAHISSERLTVRKKDGRLVPALESYAEELTHKIRFANEHNALVPVSKEGRKEYSDGDLEFWCKDLKAKLDFIKDAGFEPDMPSGYRFPPSRYELDEYREDYTELAFSVNEYIERNYTLAESIIVFKDVVNGYFTTKNLIIADDKMIVKMDNKMALPLQRLSAGEKHILIIFYCMLFHANPGEFVVLDEPEISLHVSWQQKLGSTISDIAKLRNLQVLIATHSPQIIHESWSDSRELGA